MKLEADSVIPFPKEQVFAVYRDEMTKLVPYLPNIRSIEVLERKEEGGSVRLKNLWTAKTEIPKAAQAFLKPEMLTWYDHAEWWQGELRNAWRLEMRAFTKVVNCRGGNTFVDDGKGGCIMKLRGELDLDLKELPGVPRFLAGTIGPTVEKFIVSMLTPNLLEVSKGIEQYLRAKTTS